MKKLCFVVAALLALTLFLCGCSGKPETKTTEGEYIGLIDANFIEIKISGQPEEEAFASFMLSEDIKKEFDELKLNSGEMVRIEYEKPEEGPPVIYHIERAA
jgi:PBP1b-binding outer membrane lipoprotein LpoB